MRASLVFCSRGAISGGGQRFLFEVRPDLFPQGFLTQAEIELWARYYGSLEKT